MSHSEPTTPPQRHRRATIHDVAALAQVSITTVSHALNGKGSVAEQTRQRVREAAAQLHYTADVIARGLRGNRLGVLGLVIRPLDTLDTYQPEGVDYFMRFAGAAALEALDHGLALMLVRDPSSSQAPDVALAVDGYIISDPVAADPVIDLLQRTGIPLVTVGRDIDRPDFDDVISPGTDEDTIDVLNHLAENGANTIALVLGTDNNAWNAVTESVAIDWAQRRGVDVTLHHIGEQLGREGGATMADTLMERGASGLPDAVFCLTGRHAAGLQQRLQELGVRVPEQIIIAAGSDSEQTRASNPPITSVDLSPESTARAAVQLLTDILTGTHREPVVTQRNTLHRRGSTARV